MKIIGFAGKQGSGKTTAAKFLRQEYGCPIMSFATPLKEAAKALCDFTDEQVYGTADIKNTVDSRWGFSPRQFLQQLGTEFCREIIREDFWEISFRNRLNPAIVAESELVVVDDVRFTNESELIYKLGGKVLYICGPEQSNEEIDKHRSEVESVRFSGKIDNSKREDTRSLHVFRDLVLMAVNLLDVN